LQTIDENRALRLKDSTAMVLSDEQNLVSAGSDAMGRVLPAVSPGVAFSTAVSPPLDHRLTWKYFDERGYIERGRLHVGEDPYHRNKFNQAESDRLPSNRDIPDTRHQR
jgi:hypothetical protein